jgi:hypothetical protein
MNGTFPAIAVLALVSCTSTAQQKRIEPVKVTSETIANQPGGSPLVIDLTRSEAVYAIASGIDYSRVRVRTKSKADMTMDEFISQMGGKVVGQELLLGSLSNLTVLLPSVTQYSCGPVACTCTGRKDCSDLSASGKCASGPGDAICAGSGSDFGCVCALKP